jgi:YbbR domain-containing protein
LSKLFSLDLSKALAEAAKNWPAKVLSIALALILVAFHRMSTLQERSFPVSLQIEEDGPLVPTALQRITIRVSLRGDSANIDPILSEDIEAYINLAGYTEPGLYRIPVQVRKKGNALGVEPLEIGIEPLEVSLELDRNLSKVLSLKPAFRGSLEEGYELISYTVSPSQATVSGPQKLVEGLTELPTTEIELNGRRESFSQTTEILNRNPLIRLEGKGAVEFRGIVQEPPLFRDLSDIPIILVNLDRPFHGELDRETGTLRLEGSRQDLDSYIPPEDLLVLDGSEIHAPGSYTLRVQVNTGSSLKLSRWEPEKVNLQVSVLEEAEQ